MALSYGIFSVLAVSPASQPSFVVLPVKHLCSPCKQCHPERLSDLTAAAKQPDLNLSFGEKSTILQGVKTDTHFFREEADKVEIFSAVAPAGWV